MRLSTYSRTRSTSSCPNATARTPGELPIPATYVIYQDGVIALAFVEPDYTKRVEPDALIETLAAL